MIDIDALKRKHPEYKRSSGDWATLIAISKGGAEARAVAKKLLINPDGRGGKVIKEMLKSAPLVNKIGPIVTRIAGKTFGDPIKIEGSKELWVKDFLASGGRTPTDKDEPLTFVIRQAAVAALATGKSYLQIDTGISSGAENLSQQNADELKPFVNLLDRLSVWDWEEDSSGLSMVKIHNFRLERKDWASERTPVHEFTIYWKSQGRILASRYEVRKKVKPGVKVPIVPFVEGLTEAKSEGERDYTITTPDTGDGRKFEEIEIFSINGRSIFPIISLNMPHELNIGDQLLGLQQEHYNNRVAAQWRLQRANFSMPYSQGGDEDPFANNKIGDGFYLRVEDPDVTFGEIAVSSRGVDLAFKFEDVIERDLYEFVQQLSFTAQQKAAALNRSEGSRLLDQDPEDALLMQVGAPIIKAIKKVMQVAAIAANDTFDPENWQISGLQNFKTKGLGAYLSIFEGLNNVGGVPTPSFNRQKMKDIVNRYASTMNVPRETLETLIADIDGLSDEEVMEAVKPQEEPNPAALGPGQSP